MTIDPKTTGFRGDGVYVGALLGGVRRSLQQIRGRKKLRGRAVNEDGKAGWPSAGPCTQHAGQVKPASLKIPRAVMGSSSREDDGRARHARKREGRRHRRGEWSRSSSFGSGQGRR